MIHVFIRLYLVGPLQGASPHISYLARQKCGDPFPNMPSKFQIDAPGKFQVDADDDDDDDDQKNSTDNTISNNYIFSNDNNKNQNFFYY